MNILGLLDNPTSGSYELLGTEVANLKEKERTKFRKGNIGFVFQSFNLIDELNVYENIELKYHRSLTGISDDAAEALKEYRWSGNIRELQNCIEKAVILSDGTTLTEKDLQLERSGKPAVTTIRAVSESEEERLIRDAMEQTGGNISAAAKILGVSRPTLYAKLKKYGL